MTEHSKLPWTLENAYLADANGRTILKLECVPVVPEWKNAKANAEFICKAVNAHDKLIEACNLALHNEGKQWSEIKQVLQAALDAAGE